MKPQFLLYALAITGLLTLAGRAEGQGSSTGVPVRTVVTLEARHGQTLPEITREDVMVSEGRDRDKVTDWMPAQGERAALEFFILIDDGASVSLGSQLEDIRQFINAQPATTKLGIAYMQNGTAKIVQDLTSDHPQAARALRLPFGNPGVNSSPYFALQDLIKRWPEDAPRRQVLMVTDGIDHFWGSSGQSPYVDSAIADAQRAGIMVYAIYSPGAGHDAHSYWRTYWGQIYLSQVADETGGESYYIGFSGAPVSFAPYLESITHRLTHQYLLAFLAKPEKKAGMRRIRIQTEVPNAELVAASQIYVPASE